MTLNTALDYTNLTLYFYCYGCNCAHFSHL